VATASLAVNPVNDPPVAFDDVGTVAEGGTLNEAAPGVLTNDSDAENDPLTVNTIPFTPPANGTLTLYADGAYDYIHDGSQTTSDAFVYEISDGNGGTATATVNITITGVNDPPVAFDDVGSVAEGGTLNQAAPGVLANDSDPDGDPLTVNTTPFTPPANGTLTLYADGAYDYIHDGSQTTSDAFEYEISDGNGGTATATVNITITGVNDPPVANDDVGTVAEGGTLNEAAPGVLGNDSDPENDPLTVNTTPVTPPTNGSLTLNDDGSYTYVHDGGETTSDAFVYEVSDGNGGTATATVNITITGVNDPPVANDDVGTVVEGETLNEPAPGVLANDSDPEGDPLTVNTTPVTPPANGTLTLYADGSYEYIHDGSPTTSDLFVYEACDAGPLCTPATVNLTVTGRVHVLTPSGIVGYSTAGGRNSDRHLEVTVTLVDGTGAPVAGASLTATIDGPTPGGGTATTNSSGEVTFRITNAEPGTYTTTVTEVTAEGLAWDGTTPPNSFDKGGI
jgi:VCBS repeat-containing protein